MADKLESQNQFLQRFNENLEAQVAEWTAALQKAHVQLMQQEKMSALGQLIVGLSISHQIIIERHGGKLRCNSLAGKGAEFVIELPLQQPEKLWGNVSIAQPAAILNGL